MRSHTFSVAFLWVRRGIALAMVCTITWLSLSDTTGLRQHELMHWLVRLQRATGAEQDKIVHFLMYGALAGSFWLSLPWRVRRLPSPVVAFAAASLWGVLMEFAQLAMARLGWGNRSFDVGDMAANALGAGAVALPLLALWWAVGALRRRAPRPEGEG